MEAKDVKIGMKVSFWQIDRNTGIVEDFKRLAIVKKKGVNALENSSYFLLQDSNSQDIYMHCGAFEPQQD